MELIRSATVIVLCITISAGPAFTQQTPVTPALSPSTEQPKAASLLVKRTPEGKLILEDGTPVRLRLTRTLSSADCKTGDRVDFEVLDPVKLGETVVVPQGGIAWGTITDAEHKKSMGRGGKLNVNIDSVKLANGEKVNLKATKDTKGGGHVGAMTGAMVATGIIFFPAAPLFLFIHGKDIVIPKGTEITAYVNGDTVYEAPTSTSPQVSSVNQANTELVISSAPDSAEIEIDGSFAGNTPSVISVVGGEHQVIIKKNGFQPWECKLRAAGGRVNLKAEMEPAATTLTPASSSEPSKKNGPDNKDGITIQRH